MFIEAFRFIICSSIEAFAGLALMVSVFRISPAKYVWPVSFLLLVVNLVSYLLRAEQLSYIAPALITVLYVLVITIIIRIPVLWAAIMAAIGMLIYTLLQAGVILTLYGSFDTSMQYSVKGSIVQLVTSAIALGIVWFLLRFRIGFIADFEKLRFKFEHVAILIFITSALIVLSLLMYVNNLYYVIIFMSLLAVVLLYYAFRKEAEYD
ncbi:hypothetical protein [Paenibacillus wenxiniae]|uniref:Uncharacterized protein n=1 Tax=Paenibacillus wenxiniae TaxID=1636843 RepID=A0ABW4RLZ1_9BACL